MASTSTPTLNLVVRWKSKNIPITVPGDATLAVVKAVCEEHTGVPVERQKLVGLVGVRDRDRDLDSVTLDQLNVKDGRKFTLVGTAESVEPSQAQSPRVINDLEYDAAASGSGSGSGSGSSGKGWMEQTIPDVRIEQDRGNWQGGTSGGFVTAIGWDSDTDSVIAGPGGSAVIRDGRNIKLSFGIFEEDHHGPYDWKLEDGWLPCPATSFVLSGPGSGQAHTQASTQWSVGIACTCDRVQIGRNRLPYVILYARVRIKNTGELAAVPPLPKPSASWVRVRARARACFAKVMPSGIATATTAGAAADADADADIDADFDPVAKIGPDASVVYEYAVAADRFGLQSRWPSDDELIEEGGWGVHHSHMRSYWTGLMADYAQLQLPEPAIDAAFRAAIVTTHILKTGAALNVGSNGYKRVYDHDAVGTTVALLQFGCCGDEARTLLQALPTGFQFDDATWKHAWPHAVYIQKTGDVSVARQCWFGLKEAAHKIATDRTGPGGVMKRTNDVDTEGHWTVDGWSAMTGLLAYKYVCERLEERDEAQWSEKEYASLRSAIDVALSRFPRHIPASVLVDNTENRCSNPLDANWAAHLFFGRWGFDGWLLGGHDSDCDSQPQSQSQSQSHPDPDPGTRIDDTYAYGLQRAGQAPEWSEEGDGQGQGQGQGAGAGAGAGSTPSLPFGSVRERGSGAVSFGGYPPCLYCSSYNAAYGNASLRGDRFRTLTVQAWRFLLRHAQCGPAAWWESMVGPALGGPNQSVGQGDEHCGRGWIGTHPEWGQGSCPHVWGQMCSAKALLDSLVAEFFSGVVMVGRGVPSSWLLATLPPTFSNPNPTCTACGAQFTANQRLHSDLSRRGQRLKVCRVPIADGRRLDVEMWLGRSRTRSQSQSRSHAVPDWAIPVLWAASPEDSEAEADAPEPEPEPESSPTAWFRVSLAQSSRGVLPPFLLSLPAMLHNVKGVVVCTRDPPPLSLYSAVVADCARGTVAFPPGVGGGRGEACVGVMLQRCLHE